MEREFDFDEFLADKNISELERRLVCALSVPPDPTRSHSVILYLTDVATLATVSPVKRNEDSSKCQTKKQITRESG